MAARDCLPPGENSSKLGVIQHEAASDGYATSHEHSGRYLDGFVIQ
jgi:hypothetical protein